MTRTFCAVFPRMVLLTRPCGLFYYWTIGFSRSYASRGGSEGLTVTQRLGREEEAG